MTLSKHGTFGIHARAIHTCQIYEIGICWDPASHCGSSRIWLLRCRPTNRINQKIEIFRVVDRRRNILLLKRLPFRLFRITPRAKRQLQNEQFTGFGEENWRLGLASAFSGKSFLFAEDTHRNHTNIFIRLHNTLDSRKWKVVVRFEGLLVADLERPERTWCRHMFGPRKAGNQPRHSLHSCVLLAPEFM